MKLMIIITMVMIIIFLEIWLSNFVQMCLLRLCFDVLKLIVPLILSINLFHRTVTTKDKALWPMLQS